MITESKERIAANLANFAYVPLLGALPEKEESIQRIDDAVGKSERRRWDSLLGALGACFASEKKDMKGKAK